jgi:hypothetical protein
MQSKVKQRKAKPCKANQSQAKQSNAKIEHGPIIFPRIDGLDIAICDGSIVDRCA